MKTPAQKHYEKTIAAQAADGEADQRTDANASQYELMQMALGQHKSRLSQIQSVEKKAEYKREVLPEFDAWIDGVIAGDSGLEDKVLTTLLVWHIDVGNMSKALAIANYALKHDLKMPDQYNRDLAVVVAEEVADYYLKAKAAGKPLSFPVISATVVLVDGKDMPDQVQAKLLKIFAYAVLELEVLDVEALGLAASLFKRAISLHAKVGVKKDLEAVERELKKLAADKNSDDDKAATETKSDTDTKTAGDEGGTDSKDETDTEGGEGETEKTTEVEEPPILGDFNADVTKPK